MTLPNPQDPNSPLYQFIDTQSKDCCPNQQDSSLSHFTFHQFTPESITNTLPIIVTKTNHGLLNGQAIRATKFVVMPFASATGMAQLNNQLFYIRQATLNTFELADRNSLAIDGRNFTPYIQGGQFTLAGTELTGTDVLIVNPTCFPPAGTPLLSQEPPPPDDNPVPACICPDVPGPVCIP